MRTIVTLLDLDVYQMQLKTKDLLTKGLGTKTSKADPIAFEDEEL